MSRFVGASPEHLQPPPHTADRPVLLHLAHGWGGGVERWVRDFAAADQRHWHLLLRSRTWRNAAGVRLELVDLHADPTLLLAWELDPEIADCAISHIGYRGILDEVIRVFAVEALVISSLIGQSLDAFDSGLPTIMVLHDLFPFCPALFGWFDGPCGECDRHRLARCLSENPLNSFWYHDDTAHWLALREALARRLSLPGLHIVAPGEDIHRRYAQLFPVLRERPWQYIPHGLGDLRPLRPPLAPAVPSGGRLRLLIPGRLAPHKGLYLLQEMLPELTGFAEVLLLGCGDFGLPFADHPHVEVVPDYAYSSLGERVRDFAPDCALLLSILPESFSYTLSEMSALGVPVVATRLGAFAERIHDGEDGFLVEPRAAALLDRLAALARHPAPLRRVAAVLAGRAGRSAAQMVDQYLALLPTRPGDLSRFAHGPLAQALVKESGVRDFLREQAERRKQALEDEQARLAAQLAGHAQRAAAWERRALAWEARAMAQERRAADLQANSDRLTRLLDQARQRLISQDGQIDELNRRLHSEAAERDALLASTSWRLTAPLRKLSTALRQPTLTPAAAPQGSDGPPAARPAPSASAPPSLAGNPDGGAAAAASPADPASPPGVTDSGVTDSAGGSGSGVTTSRCAAPGVAPVAVHSRPGDILGWTRARWVEEGLTRLGHPLQAPSGLDPTPEGFSLVLRDSLTRQSLLGVFDGLQGEPGQAAEALVAELGQVLVGSARLAADFRRRWPAAKANVVVQTAPWLGEWALPVDRPALHRLQRERIGLADRSRVVLGIGAPEDSSGLAQFATLAERACARRNDLRFVWLGARNPAWERENAAALALPLALRRLFLLTDRNYREWLSAADAYLGCRATGVLDPGAWEALATGLPLCVASPDALPDQLSEPACWPPGLTFAAGDAALDWLLDLPGPALSVEPASGLVKQIDNPALRRAWLAQCEAAVAARR